MQHFHRFRSLSVSSRGLTLQPLARQSRRKSECWHPAYVQKLLCCSRAAKLTQRNFQNLHETFYGCGCRQNSASLPFYVELLQVAFLEFHAGTRQRFEQLVDLIMFLLGFSFLSWCMKKNPSIVICCFSSELLKSWHASTDCLEIDDVLWQCCIEWEIY